VDDKVRDGDEDGNDMGGYERMWKIWGTTCLIGGRIPNNAVFTCRIRSHTCSICKDKLTCVPNYFISQSLMIISPISSCLSLCHQQHYHHKRIQAYAIYFSLSMP